MCAASRDNLAAGAVAKSISRFQCHVAASAAGGRIVAAGDDLGLRAKSQLIGSNEFDDPV